MLNLDSCWFISFGVPLHCCVRYLHWHSRPHSLYLHLLYQYIDTYLSLLCPPSLLTTGKSDCNTWDSLLSESIFIVVGPDGQEGYNHYRWRRQGTIWRMWLVLDYFVFCLVIVRVDQCCWKGLRVVVSATILVIVVVVCDGYCGIVWAVWGRQVAKWVILMAGEILFCLVVSGCCVDWWEGMRMFVRVVVMERIR